MILYNQLMFYKHPPKLLIKIKIIPAVGEWEREKERERKERVMHNTPDSVRTGPNSENTIKIQHTAFCMLFTVFLFLTIKIIDLFFIFKCKAVLIYRFIYKALHFHLKSIIWLLCNCYGFRNKGIFSSSEIHNFQCLELFLLNHPFFLLIIKMYIKMAWSWYSGTLAFLRQDPLFRVCAR